MPSLTTLERLLAAAGRTLELSTSEPAETKSRPVARVLDERREEVRALLRSHGVTHAAVFGSVSRQQDSLTSDLDLLVELPRATYVRLAALRADLEDLLGVPVDVATPELLTEAAREAAEHEAVPL
jgi:predicted nucleotidyltransferase